MTQAVGFFKISPPLFSINSKAISFFTDAKIKIVVANILFLLGILAIGIATGGFGFLPHILPLSEVSVKILSLLGLLSPIVGIYLFQSLDSSFSTCVNEPPIGIENVSNNCWANSLLQFCQAVPVLKNFCKSQWFWQTLHPIGSFLAEYESDQNRKSAVSAANSQAVRACLSAQSVSYIAANGTRERSISSDMHVQCDASEALSIILNQMSCPVKMQTIHRCKNHEREWVSSPQEYQDMPKIELPLGRSRSFVRLFESFLKSTPQEPIEGMEDPITKKRDGHVVSEERLFQSAPPDLFVSLGRFANQRTSWLGASWLGRLFGGADVELLKVDDAIDIPDVIPLKDEFVHTHKGANYQVDAFIQHRGSSLGHGHYVAYVKSPEGVWFECNDALVRRISLSTAERERARAYLLHFHKV